MIRLTISSKLIACFSRPPCIYPTSLSSSEEWRMPANPHQVLSRGQMSCSTLIRDRPCSFEATLQYLSDHYRILAHSIQIVGLLFWFEVCDTIAVLFYILQLLDCTFHNQRNKLLRAICVALLIEWVILHVKDLLPRKFRVMLQKLWKHCDNKMTFLKILSCVVATLFFLQKIHGKQLFF